jgi:hypothetical protein
MVATKQQKGIVTATGSISVLPNSAQLKQLALYNKNDESAQVKQQARHNGLAELDHAESNYTLSTKLTQLPTRLAGACFCM